MTFKVNLPEEPAAYLPEEQQKDHTKALDELNRQATMLAVYDAISERQMAEVLGRAKQRKEQLDAFRQAIVGPFNQHIRRINAFFGTLTDAYNPVIEAATRKLGAWRSQEDARIAKEKAEEQHRLQETNKKRTAEALAKDINPDVLVKKTTTTTEAPKSVMAQTSRLTYREVVRHEISAKALANPCKEIPKQYISVDEQKVSAAVRGKIIPAGDHGWVRVWIEKQPISVKI